MRKELRGGFTGIYYNTTWVKEKYFNIVYYRKLCYIIGEKIAKGKILHEDDNGVYILQYYADEQDLFAV